MLDEAGFNELMDAIVAQGFDEETAAEYAAFIGDTPIVDKDGFVLVMDGDKVLARLKPETIE